MKVFLYHHASQTCLCLLIAIKPPHWSSANPPRPDQCWWRPFQTVRARYASHMHSHSLQGNLFIFPVCCVHFISVIGFAVTLSRPRIERRLVWSPFIFSWNTVSLHSLHPIKGRLSGWESKQIYTEKEGEESKWMLGFLFISGHWPANQTKHSDVCVHHDPTAQNRTGS